MKRNLSFIKKEFLHILRDSRTMLILIGMPIVQILLFGFAISTEIKDINLGVVFSDYKEQDRQLIRKIDANEYFTVVDSYRNIDEAEDLMKKGKLDVILNFYDNQIQVIVDASNPNISSSEQLYLQQIVEPNTNSSLKMLYNPQMLSSYNFVPGILGLIMIIICAMMTSVSIVREKELGTMEVLLVSPLNRFTIVLSKMVPYFCLSVLNLFIILLLSRFLLKVPLAGSLFWIVAISIIYILLALALGLLISTIVQTQIAAMLSSAMLLLLPILLLSGMIFPLESAPEFFRWFSGIIPAKWYVSAMKKLMVEGLNIKFVLKELAILSFMTLALVGLALSNFKKRL